MHIFVYSKTVFLLTFIFVFFFAVNLPLKTGRKLLQKDLNNNSTSEGVSKPVSTNNVGIFAGGALLACCAVLCPCFYGKKRKATAHAVLAKDPNSSEFMFMLCLYILLINSYHLPHLSCAFIIYVVNLEEGKW